MKLTITEKIEIKDGLHTGAIIAVEYREKPYQYTDVVIEFAVNDTPIKVKAGYPTVVSDTSKLGKLLIRFGETLEVGSDIDPDKVLIGKMCQFVTLNETTSSGTFAKVLPDSLKP